MAKVEGVACPYCADLVQRHGERYNAVYTMPGYKYDGRYKDLPFCERHGCVLVNGEWILECQTCGEHVDKLFGLFVPHNCEPCHRALIEEQKRMRHICGKCGKVYALCYC